MRITVEAVDAPRQRVSFHTSLGSGEARWSGPEPRVGESYDVEIEIDDELRWGQSLRPAEEARPRLRQLQDGSLELAGEVVLSEDDGFVGLRCGESVVSLEVEGPRPAVGEWVVLRAKAVTLFDQRF